MFLYDNGSLFAWKPSMTNYFMSFNTLLSFWIPLRTQTIMDNDASPLRSQTGTPNITDYLTQQEEASQAGSLQQQGQRPPSNVTPSTATKRKAFTLDDTDDEEESDAKKPAGECDFPFKIIRVQNNSLPGFVFYCSGYADRILGNILYERSTNKNYGKFVKYVECAKRTCTLLEAGSKTIFRKNYKGYTHKGMAIVFKSGTVVSEEFITKWFEETFMPAWETLTEGDLHDNQKPAITEDSWEMVTNWSDIVKTDNLSYIFTSFKERFKIKERMGQWINLSSDNLYSIYTRGELPKNVYKGYNIKREIMDAFDVRHLCRDNAP